MNTEKCKQCEIDYKEKGILRPPCSSCQIYLKYIKEVHDSAFMFHTDINPGISKVVAEIKNVINKSGKTNEQILEILDKNYGNAIL